MPFLTFLRHAKAAQPLPGQKDFDRKLTERGRNDAARMGKLLVDLKLDLVLVSAAVRTVETWEIASGAFEQPPEPVIEPSLYLCRAGQMIERLHAIPAETQSVLVVGHNPYIQEVALWLAGKSKGPEVNQMREKYPTAALATFKVDGAGWSELSTKTVTLERFVIPRSLD
jgi:phosphohistidine phosphatase